MITDDKLTKEEKEKIKEQNLKQLAKDQEEYYKRQARKEGISEFGNGKSNNKRTNPIITNSEKEIERNRILNEIQKLRQENPELSSEERSNALREKRQVLIDKIEEHFPKISFKVLLELDFVLYLPLIFNLWYENVFIIITQYCLVLIT